MMPDACAPMRRQPTRYPAPPMSLRSSTSRCIESKGNKEDTIYRSKAVGEPPLMLGISVWTAIFDAIAEPWQWQHPRS
jgi:xanthine dehydrogenase molybdopterin-binding subunit B